MLLARAMLAAKRYVWVFLFGWLTPWACGPTAKDIQARKDQAIYHYKLAHGYYFDRTGKDGDLALQEALTSIELDPNSADTRMLAGLIFMGRERYLDAISEFEKAIALRPDFFFAQNNLGATYLALERWDDAIELFDALVANITYSTPGNAHNNLGWAWYKKGDIEKAKRHYLHAIQLAPALCPPYNNLGMLYLEQSKSERAEKYLQRCIKRCPTYAEPYYHLGRIEAERAETTLAAQHFEKCAHLGGDSPLAERCELYLAGVRP